MNSSQKTKQSPLEYMDEVTAVIIEDVIKEMDALKYTIKEQFPHVNIVGEAYSYQSAIDLILRIRPLVIFTDIRLGGDLEGFDVINYVKEQGFSRFVPVFITAYGSEEYAVRGLKYSGGLYLRKPLNGDSVKEMMEDVFRKLQERTFNFDLNDKKMEQIIRLMKDDGKPKYDYVRDVDGNEVAVPMADIVYIEVENTNTYIVLKNSKMITTKHSLKSFEDRYVKDFNFFRVHHSIIFNIDYLDYYKHAKLEIHTLVFPKAIKASQRFGEDFKKYLKENKPGGLDWWNRLF